MTSSNIKAYIQRQFRVQPRLLLALAIGALASGTLVVVNPWLVVLPWAALAAAAVVIVFARPRSEMLRNDLYAQKEAWGGRAIVLLAVSYVTSSLLTRLVDGAEFVTEPTGEHSILVTGTVGKTLGFVIVAAAIACAVAAIGTRTGPLKVGSWYGRWALALVAWGLACAVGLRLQIGDAWQWIESTCAAVLAIAVIASPPNRRTLLNLAHLLNLTVASLLLYSFIHPDQQLPCRADKCGIFGSLFIGYLFQENAAARLVVLLIPTAWVIPSRTYLAATLIGAGIWVGATGSRTSYSTYGVAVLAVLVLRWANRTCDRSPWRPNAAIRAIPIIMLTVSTWAFLTAAGDDFTGRGRIWQGIRNALAGWGLVTGSGPETVSHLQIGFFPVGEHGQAPHLLVNTGAPGLIFFALALASIMVKREWSPTQATTLVLALCLSTQFVTEVALTMDTRTIPYALLLLSIGLMRDADSNQPVRLAMVTSPGSPTPSPKLVKPEAMR
jgi:hypothetical protein